MIFYTLLIQLVHCTRFKTSTIRNINECLHLEEGLPTNLTNVQGSQSPLQDS